MFKLTVVICTYNEEFSILKALRSLKSNKIYDFTEIVLVDDCSSNKTTCKILRLLKASKRYKVILNNRNAGLSHSRNVGFEQATTEYVVPLDGDDILPSGALDAIYERFSEDPSIDFLFGNYEIVDIDGHQSEIVNCKEITENGFINATKLALNWKLLGTSPCKKNTWSKVGGYSLKYSYSVQDVDFWIRVILSGAIGAYVDKMIYQWNKTATGMNASFDRINMIRLLEDHSGFYELIYTTQQIQDQIFEGHYPYKAKATLLPIIRKSFFKVRVKNKVRMIHFILTNLFSSAEI